MSLRWVYQVWRITFPNGIPTCEQMYTYSTRLKAQKFLDEFAKKDYPLYIIRPILLD